MSEGLDTRTLDDIIVGRVTPHIYAFLTTTVPRHLKVGDDVAGEEEKMCKKIGVIISNPPYQAKGGSGGSNDAPIYQDYSMIAARVTDRYSSLIIRANWFTGGRENLLGPFRKEMLECGQLRTLQAFPNGGEVFPGSVEIKAGVCYYLRDSDRTGNCDYFLHQKGEIIPYHDRKLADTDVFIRDPRLAEIVENVLARARELGQEHFVSEILSGDTPFGIPTNPSKSKKTPFPTRETRGDGFDVKLYLLGDKQKRTIAYVRREDIKKNA